MRGGGVVGGGVPRAVVDDGYFGFGCGRGRGRGGGVEGECAGVWIDLSG